jgi:hypothetical protein
MLCGQFRDVKPHLVIAIRIVGGTAHLQQLLERRGNAGK